MQLTDRNVEGEVDKLLHDELKQDPTTRIAFCKLLADRALREIMDVQDGRVERSPKRVSRNGQTDLGLFFQSGPDKIAILIENKVISPFTDRQPERYLEEKRALIQNGRFEKVGTVLIAPAKYCRSNGCSELFDAVVHYEEFAYLFPETKALQKAIDYCEAGWVPEEIPQVTSNFEIYASLVKEGFPRLAMKTKTSIKPLQSRTIRFHEPAFGSRGNWPLMTLLHQWQEGRAKLLIGDWGAFRDGLKPIVEQDLKDTAFTVDPNRTKSFGFMIPTPAIDNTSSEDQSGEMIKGLSAVQELADWYSANHHTMSKWAEIAVGDAE